MDDLVGLTGFIELTGIWEREGWDDVNDRHDKRRLVINPAHLVSFQEVETEYGAQSRIRTIGCALHDYTMVTESVDEITALLVLNIGMTW